MSEALLNQYFKPRAPGEVNLVALARQALIDAQIPADKLAIFNNDVNIRMSEDANLNIQRFKLNTWMDTQYLAHGRGTQDQRLMILTSAIPEVWIDNFIKYHIPQMKLLNLPMAYPAVAA